MEMKGINNIRIDDRLIHGQVATMWSNKLGSNTFNGSERQRC